MSMYISELIEAMAEHGQTTKDIIAIYSIKEGDVEIKDLIPEDSYVFTEKFVYVVCIYDGDIWFSAVPISKRSAATMKSYGSFGG